MKLFLKGVLMKKMLFVLLVNCFVVHASALSDQTQSLLDVLDQVSKVAQGAVGSLVDTKDKDLMIEIKSQSEMAYEIGVKMRVESDYTFTEFKENSWEDIADEAWGADSSIWGGTDFESALSYVESNQEIEYYLENTDDEKQKEEFKQNLKLAVESFKTLKDKSLDFIVAPMGAVQCGVTFPVVLIIDKKDGAVYQVSMEGSGC
jgi:REP element-mobilizing transposase RayT